MNKEEILAKADLIDFEKGNGLVPAIAQDYKTKDVLMLAYMNKESLIKTLEGDTAWYYSRSRNELWNKGATSGHLQYVKEITEHANIFFGDTVELETEECRGFLNLEHIPTLIDALEAKVEAAEVVDEAFVKAMFKEIQKEHGIKGKNLFMGSRIILTGQMHGPDLPKTMEVLGKETCLNRIKYVKNNVL